MEQIEKGISLIYQKIGKGIRFACMDLDDSKVYSRKSFKGLRNEKNSGKDSHGKTLVEEANRGLDVASDDSSSQVVLMGSRGTASSGKGVGKFGFSRQENRVVIHLSTSSKKEMMEIRRKLESELDLVRKLVRKIEGKEGPIIEGDLGSSARGVHSEVVSGGARELRPLYQLSISVLENSQGLSENVEKEKRTPKANQLYRKSEFLLAKDRFPPAECNKKSKSNGKKQGGGELGKFPNQVLKSCSAVLEKLMKHKHGWVFNKPVDTKALGLHDYFDIIKHPMDLGTVKSHLDKNWYKSPREFAEDVRLTFENAMTYNPKGQDVHVMAEQLLKIFEDKWTVIEADYMRELRLAVDNEVGLPAPKSKKAPPRLLPPPEMSRILDRSDSTTHSVDPAAKLMNNPHSGRTPAPKKPKARDPNKREMTFDEKQKLSTNLQSLPSEKLDNVVQIIKKRNPSLSNYDDEIEVDIDTFDTETLWELDRFVTNYKKSLSKNKRKAELANPETPIIQEDVQDKNPAPVEVESPKEAETDGKKTSSLSPDQVEKHGAPADRSSSSGSHSGSSSSDSGSDNSSGHGSEAAHSPRT